MDTMLQDLTRVRLIQIWFVAVLLVVVASLALGVSVTLGTGAMLLLLCLVPPAIVLKLWPGSQQPTAGDVLRGTDRRN